MLYIKKLIHPTLIFQIHIIFMILILSHIYYLIGILILVITFRNIVLFNKHEKLSEWYTKFKKVTGHYPKLQDYEEKNDYELLLKKDILRFFEFLWILLGILTNNWIIFLFLIICNLIINILYKKLNYNILSKILILKYLLVKLVIYLFLIINHFHIHFNLNDYLLNIFN